MVKTLGQRVRELREEADLSLRELAKRVGDNGVSAAFLSDVELGRRHPSEKMLPNLAKALKTTSSELQKYDTSAPVQEMRERVAQDPVYGLAFRQLLKLPKDELLKLAEQQRRKRR
jgi:transcriptional regulator with XRE-family HTH domain